MYICVSIFRSVSSCLGLVRHIHRIHNTHRTKINRNERRKSNNNNKRKMIEIRQREMRLHFNSQFTCGSCTFRLFLCIFQYDCVCAVGRPMSHKIIDTYVNEQKFSYQSLFAFVSFLVSFNERVLLAMLRTVR